MSRTNSLHTLWQEKKEEKVVKNCNEFRDDGQINTRLEKYVCCAIMDEDMSN